MSSNVLWIALAVALIATASCESIKSRVDHAFSMLHQKCRNRVRQTCIPQLSTVETTTHRIELCANYINRNPMAYCMQTSNCSNEEIQAFRGKVCNFDQVNALKEQIQQFTTECRPVFQRCMTGDSKVRRDYDSEDYCSALDKESMGYKCFHDARFCGRDHDKDLYEEIYDATCGSPLTMQTSSLLVMVLCCLVSKLNW